MSTAGQFDDVPPQVDPEDDFLAFWREQEAAEAPETLRILGVDIVVPTDLPLKFERLAEALGESSKTEDVKRLLQCLFGQDVLDRWVDNDVTGKQFKFLLAWGVANGQGTPTTFAEAAELVAKAEAAEAKGKAPVVPNRADRRASSRTAASSTSGGASKPTSRASTRSARKA